MPLTKPYSKDTPSTVTLDDGTVRDVPEHMTLAEFTAFPWPVESHWELIWEVPVLAPSPLPPHQTLARVLTNFIESCLEKRQKLFVCMDVDVQLPMALSYVRPDVVVVDSTKTDIESAPLETVPLLLVEALSPSNSSIDMGPKRDAYAEAGVPEYWIADPQTGAVAINVGPKDGVYQNPPADKDGYVTSPLLGVAFRVSRDGSKFTVLTK
jgi:Uma2 family endonuclease